MARLSNGIQRVKTRYQMEPQHTAALFAMEGAAYTTLTYLSTNNNNLFATRLGASDFQLSLLSMFSQIIGICLLIPGAIYTDRLKNKKKMVVIVVGLLGLFCLLAGLSPFAGVYALTGYILFASILSGINSLYNSSWQSFFADAVSLRNRNMTYTMRTRLTLVVGISVQLIVGALLSSQMTDAGKIQMHQIQFFTAVIFAAVQIIILTRVRGGETRVPSGTTMHDFVVAAKDLFHNKRFLKFIGVALFFYMFWHLDWTVYYIGQTKYVGCNELWLSISNGASSLAQFLTIGFWSKRNEKHGVRFGMILGAAGLMLAPLAIIVPMMLQEGIRPLVHTVLRSVFDMTFANISLNVLQNLLQVIGEKNRTLSIAVYTAIIAISNAFMPMVGVELYTVLGADAEGMIWFNVVAMIIRAFTVGAWYLRYRSMKGETDR